MQIRDLIRYYCPKYIRKSCNKNKKTNPISKWAKDSNRHVSKDIPKGKKHLRLPTSSVGKMQIKTTARYHSITSKMASTKKTGNNKYCHKDAEKLEMSKMVVTLESSQQFVRKIKHSYCMTQQFHSKVCIGKRKPYIYTKTYIQASRAAFS